MKILSITGLYPNAEQPTFGVFVENRLRKLAERPDVDLRVVAPVPWFPLRHAAFGRYGSMARVPLAEQRHGIEITHPRYLQIPKVGTSLTPFLLYLSLLGHVRKTILPDGDFDLIDAHYYYPDGVAAALLAHTLNKPITVTARGTDLNLIPKHYPLARRMIVKTARKVNASITVCAALRDTLIELGAEPMDVHVMRNGVDLTLFRPLDHETARRRYQLDRPALLSVGHLIERKGHDLVIRALSNLPAFELLIAGDGPERGRLQKLARTLGVADRVRFLGVIDHEDLAPLYSAAEFLVLASSREGWPNVLLESMACGTPVIATRNWGTPEIVSAPEAGLLMDERTSKAIADAVRTLVQTPTDRALTRRFAEAFSWDDTTRGQLNLFSSILSGDTLRSAA